MSFIRFHLCRNAILKNAPGKFKISKIKQEVQALRKYASIKPSFHYKEYSSGNDANYY